MKQCWFPKLATLLELFKSEIEDCSERRNKNYDVSFCSYFFKVQVFFCFYTAGNYYRWETVRGMSSGRFAIKFWKSFSSFLSFFSFLQGIVHILFGNVLRGDGWAREGGSREVMR